MICRSSRGEEMRFPALLVLSTVVLSFAGIRSVVKAQENARPEPRTIQMTATNYAFTPSSVHVKVGETVRLSIVAEDKEHGVRIKPVAEGSAPGTAPGLEISGNEDCAKFKKH